MNPSEQTDVAPTAAIIFGVTGDLTHRKLVPALCELELRGQLQEKLTIIGIARRDCDTALQPLLESAPCTVVVKEHSTIR